MKKLSAYLIFGITIFLAMSCEKTKDSDPIKFDRTTMLSNYANNLIAPSFQNCLVKIDSLKAAQLEFSKLQNSAALIKLKTTWINAYQSWQRVNSYNFGPAGEEGLNKSLNEEVATFPVSVSKIGNAISAGSTDFKDFNRDNRGFLAIEYLVFEKDIAQTIELFKDSKRMKYLDALIDHARSRVEKVSLAWNGNYKNEFISNNGTDAGSSTSALYNEFVKSFEGLKNFKLSLPLGKRPGQVKAEPNLVEAYYSGTSLQMAKLHYSAIKDIWYGRGFNAEDGIGFREYLESVEGGKELIVATESQLQVIDDKFAQMPVNGIMQDMIANNDETLIALHMEIQKHTRFFKSDMSSLLGIAITFSSGDGD